MDYYEINFEPSAITLDSHDNSNDSDDKSWFLKKDVQFFLLFPTQSHNRFINGIIKKSLFRWMAVAENWEKREKSVMTGSRHPTANTCHGPFSGSCPNLAAAVVLRKYNTPICHPLLTMGTPLSQLRYRLNSGTFLCTWSDGPVQSGGGCGGWLGGAGGGRQTVWPVAE